MLSSKRFLGSIFFILIFIPPFSSVIAEDFTAKNIWGGWVRGVVEAPSAPGTFYAVSYGVFKSTDGGQSWIKKPTPIAPAGVGTNWGRHETWAIAVSPTDANVVVVGDGQWSPIWVSTNGAESFSVVTLGSEEYANYKMAKMVTSSLYNSNIFFASIERQTFSSGETSTLYMTTDGGTNWSSTGWTVSNTETITDVLQIPSTGANPGRIVVCVVDKYLQFWVGNAQTPTTGKIYYGNSDGTSFTQVPAFTVPSYKMTWDATNNKIWMITATGEIYNSTDGISWSVMISSVAGAITGQHYPVGILYSATTPPSMFAFASAISAPMPIIYRSTDAAGVFPASSWQKINLPSTVGKEVLRNALYGMVVDTSHTAGSHWGIAEVEKGFYYTTSTAAGLITANDFNQATGINTTSLVYGIKDSPTGRVYALAYNDVYYSGDNGSNWTHVYPQKGAQGDTCRYMTFDPASTSKAYLVTNSKVYYTNNNGADLFGNTLKDFSSILSGSSQTLTNVLINASNPDIMFIGIKNNDIAIQGNYLYRSEDAGLTWSQVAGLSCHGIYYLAMDPNDANTIYAACGDQWATGAGSVFTGNGDGLLRSTDGGTNWTNLGIGSSKIFHISLDVDKPNYIVVGYQVWGTSDPVCGYTSHSTLSIDKGITWNDLYVEAPPAKSYDIYNATAPFNMSNANKLNSVVSFLVGDNIYAGNAEGIVYMSAISSNVGSIPMQTVTTLPTAITWMFKGSAYATTGSGLYSLNLSLSTGSVTSVSTYDNAEITLYNYPNPFNPKTGGTTSIKLSIPNTAEDIKIKIYSLSGDLVSEDTYNNYTGGYSYTFVWDGKNQKGELCAPGVYFVVVDVDGEKVRNKIVIIY